VVLDLRLPDMSGFEVLDHIRNATRVERAGGGVHGAGTFSGGRCGTSHHGAKYRGEGRGIAGRLLDETFAVFAPCDHGIAAEKQRMLEKLNSPMRSRWQTALLVDDDARNIFALSERAGTARHEGADGDTGTRRSRLVESNPRIAIVLMDS